MEEFACLAAKLAQENDIPLIIDEVQTGNGRTGAMYAYMNYGIETQKSAKEVVNTCLENGVLCLTAKDKVRLLPPLNIPMDLLEKAVSIIKAACI